MPIRKEIGNIIKEEEITFKNPVSGKEAVGEVIQLADALGSVVVTMVGGVVTGEQQTVEQNQYQSVGIGESQPENSETKHTPSARGAHVLKV